MRHMRFSGWLMLAACLTASGCSSSDQEELQTWMAQERANAKPRVKPLEEPKTFTPEAYLGSDGMDPFNRSEEHTSELQSQSNLVCRLLLEKKKKKKDIRMMNVDIAGRPRRRWTT